MKISTIYIQNFLTIGRASLNLADQGLHVLQGVNEDDSSAESNGSGKSSVVDALCWCLFGITARGVKGDAVVSRIAKTDCYVALLLQNGATSYKVERYRKDRVNKNTLRVIAMSASGSVDMSRGTDAETQKVVTDILGCSLEVFLAAVYSGQELMPDLPRKTDKELKTLIEEAAGLQRIERAYNEALTRKLGVGKEVDRTTDKLAASKALIARVQGSLEDVQQKRDKWEGERKDRVGQSGLRVTELQAHLLASARIVKDATEQYEKDNEEVAAIDAGLTGHSAAEQRWKDQLAVVGKAQRLFDQDMNVVRNTKALVRDRSMKVDNALAEMSKPCSECGKPHTEDELHDYKARHIALLKEAEQALETVALKANVSLTTLDAERKKADDFEALVPDVSEVTRRRSDLQTAIKRYLASREQLKAIKRDLDAAKVQLALRESEPNPHESAATMAAGQLAAETATFSALEVALEGAKKALETAESVAKVFGPAGVRAQILDTVTPYLNDRTADYLSVLSDGNIQATWTTLTKSKTGELKEKFSIDVTNGKGADSFLGLSGGEKRKVRLATALALQDLVASRATQPIELWIGDEIDDALDSAGLERLMTILERKARERGTVLVISHNELTDWSDNVTTVIKKGGVATVEGSLCADHRGARGPQHSDQRMDAGGAVGRQRADRAQVQAEGAVQDERTLPEA